MTREGDQAADPASPPPEWLEVDGLGGFASGTVAGHRTRRYHGHLTVALTPPTNRTMLVSGFDAWVEAVPSRSGDLPQVLSRQRYRPDVTAGRAIAPDAFTRSPWPTWTFRLSDGTEIEQELLALKGEPVVAVRWRVVRAVGPRRLVVRPFLTGRDIHALHRENGDFRFDAEMAPTSVRWRPYPALPAVVSHHDGSYQHAPVWYRGFQLDEERDRGFDYLEDAGSPGTLSWDLSAGPAHWILVAETGANHFDVDGAIAAAYDGIRRRERLRRSRVGGALEQAGDAYLVQRGAGKTIVAGYPWFTDWGRDTFISLRGLCLATGRLDDARSILVAWSETVSEGMLPNRFIDQGDVAEFNSVDASLWFVVAASELMAGYQDRGKRLSPGDRTRLVDAIQAILEGYCRGTRYRIRADDDALLAAGEAGVQLTWMDAKVGDWVVTPRIGKPVEVQALWYNALRLAGEIDRRWQLMADRVGQSFLSRFWNDATGCLHDVVDRDHVVGQVDPAIRPNQIFAVGGLPHSLVTGAHAERIVEVVERDLLTPLGLRSLAPTDPSYQGRYRGGPKERDGAYHQGTVWPWLIGPFVEAWLRTRGDSPAQRETAQERFLAPLIDHLEQAGLGHVSEIADGDPPYRPNGCPFQAWSVGELLRLSRIVDSTPGAGRSLSRPRSTARRTARR